eukprot:GHVH01012246.1.p2 GENE.GHVH01012246.1~~GHVH01012246.1.p2  ORF type:complete len:816 (+),score=116.02 GHVH01012246.1:2733-5180(+)
MYMKKSDAINYLPMVNAAWSHLFSMAAGQLAMRDGTDYLYPLLSGFASWEDSGNIDVTYGPERCLLPSVAFLTTFRTLFLGINLVPEGLRLDPFIPISLSNVLVDHAAMDHSTNYITVNKIASYSVENTFSVKYDFSDNESVTSASECVVDPDNHTCMNVYYWNAGSIDIYSEDGSLYKHFDDVTNVIPQFNIPDKSTLSVKMKINSAAEINMQLFPYAHLCGQSINLKTEEQCRDEIESTVKDLDSELLTIQLEHSLFWATTKSLTEYVNDKTPSTPKNCIGKAPPGVAGVISGSICWPPSEPKAFVATKEFDNTNYCDYYDYGSNENEPINDETLNITETMNVLYNEPYVHSFEDYMTVKFNVTGITKLEGEYYYLLYVRTIQEDAVAIDCSQWSILQSDDLNKCVGTKVAWKTKVDDNAFIVDDHDIITLNLSITGNRNISPWSDDQPDMRSILYNTGVSTCFTLVEYHSGDNDAQRVSNETCADTPHSSVMYKNTEMKKCDHCGTPSMNSCDDCYQDLTCTAKQLNPSSTQTYAGCYQSCLFGATDKCAANASTEFCACNTGANIGGEARCEKDLSWFSGGHDSLRNVNDFPTGSECNFCSDNLSVASCGRCPLGGLGGVLSKWRPLLTNPVADSWSIVNTPRQIGSLPQCFDTCSNMKVYLDDIEVVWSDEGNDLTGHGYGSGIRVDFSGLTAEKDAIWGLYFDYDQAVMEGQNVTRVVTIDADESFVKEHIENGVIAHAGFSSTSVESGILISIFTTISDATADYASKTISINLAPKKPSPYTSADEDVKLVVNAIHVAQFKPGIAPSN